MWLECAVLVFCSVLALCHLSRTVTRIKKVTLEQLDGQKGRQQGANSLGPPTKAR